MGDAITERPDHECLFAVAATQGGYSSAGQARQCGFGWDLLTYHTRSGRFIRVHRGLYRLRDYPSWPREEVMAAWLAADPTRTVVSHESALDLLELSDIIPDAIHLTVPRSRRHLPKLPGVTFHTTTRVLRDEDVTVREAMRLTAATRTIIDAAEAGVAPDQIEMAIGQALSRGWTTPSELRARARQRSARVHDLVTQAIERGER